MAPHCPSSLDAGYARITPLGQLAGAAIMFGGLGFLPCYVAAWILKKAGLLRIPWQVELAGLDHTLLAEEATQIEEILDAERETLAQS